MALTFPHPDNTTVDLLHTISYVNSTTDVGQGGSLGLVILFVIFGGTFLLGKAFTFERALPAATMITTIIGILLGILGLVSNTIVYGSIILLCISIYMLVSKGRGET